MNFARTTSTHRRPALVLGFVAAAAVILPTGVAAGAVVEGTSIGSARLGMTKAQIRSELGTPEQVNGQNWSFDDGRVFFAKGRATLIATTDKREATSRGIRNGSSKARIQKAYPDAVCVPEGKSRRLCAVASKVDGKPRQTVFYLSPANKVWFLEVNSAPLELG